MAYDWGKALGGIGAALQGNYNEWQNAQTMRERNRLIDEQSRRESLADLEAERQKAMAIDFRKMYGYGKAGQWDEVGKLVQDRMSILDAEGRDTTHTANFASMLAEARDTGDWSRADGNYRVFEQAAIDEGLLEKMESGGPAILKTSQVDGSGQYFTLDGGKVKANKVEGFQRDTVSEGADEADRALRARQIAVTEAAEQRQAAKLSAGLEKAMLEAQDRTVEAQRNANEYDVLAGDFDRMPKEGGLQVTFSEGLKAILGEQDDVTEWRRRFNKVRMSEGLKHLPPGPATDKDVQLAMRGVPPENAPPEQVQSFLRGAARLARLDAAYNQFKADFIASNRTGGGLNREWRSSVLSSKLGRKVTVAEIYETAMNRGITPEDVRSELDIQ